MNEKQIKRIRKWCKASWEATPIEQRSGFSYLEEYVSAIKKECLSNPKSLEFINHSLKTHYRVDK